MNIELTTEQIKKLVIAVAGIIIIAVLFFNCTYQVKEQEQAVVLTFGDAKTVSTSGLHFKIPFIQTVEKVDTTIKGFSIGYDQETGESIELESLMITSDYNFVNVDFFVEYQVSDPVLTLYASKDPVAILKNIAQSCIRTVVGNTTVDNVLTTGKSEIQASIKEMINKRLEEQELGIFLVNITMQDAEPPTKEVMEAFKAVETAKQGKETALNNANKYKNEKTPAATASVDQILQSAEATKQERINEANGQVSRFEKMYAEYAKFPAVTKLRMFYETMEELLPNLEIIIDSGDGSNVQKLLPLGSFSGLTETATEATTEKTTE
jgi:membrane protease subunit HflK